MYRIEFTQIEKLTGKVIGTGQSAKSYIRRGNAERYKAFFEVENDQFLQTARIKEA